MAYKIKQTGRFLKKHLTLLTYLENEWGFKVASEFQDKPDAKLDKLSHSPGLGTTTLKKPGIKRLIITKHNKIYYRVKGKTIYIILLFDTRQNPKRNKYE